MKKEIIICIATILLIVFLDYITQNNTSSVMASLEESLNLTRESIVCQEDDKTMEEIEETLNIWNDKKDVLSLYIEHDELEKIEMYMKMVKTDLETKEYNMALEALDTCLFVIEHTKDKYTLSIKNIF